MPFEVEQVIGSGSVQELICQPITFPAPAEEVKEIRKTVIIDNCLVVWDKVIVDGRLRKDIMFKQAAAGFPIPGNVAACTGVVATITGPIFDVDVDIAFNAMIPVPGARPGDKCVFLQAFVEGEKEEAADIQANGSFNTLLDKSIVFLCVKTNVSKMGPPCNRDFCKASIGGATEMRYTPLLMRAAGYLRVHYSYLRLFTASILASGSNRTVTVEFVAGH